MFRRDELFQLHERLRTELRRRINEGTLTGTLLARRSGLAQAHISKFLSGKTNLSDVARDRILAALNLSVEALLAPRPEEPSPDPAYTLFRLLRANELADADYRTANMTVQVPLQAYNPTPPVGRHVARERFVALILEPGQARPMEPILRPDDIVLVDRYNLNPGKPQPGKAQLDIFALQLTRGVTLFRHVIAEPAREPLRGRWILQPAGNTFPAQSIPAPRPDSAESPILGRVVGLLRIPNVKKR